jgi:hypothetical protein
LNADGLGPDAELHVELTDEQFRPLPGYSGPDVMPLRSSGLREAVRWRGREAVRPPRGPFRVRVSFVGSAPRQARLFAAYLATS